MTKIEFLLDLHQHLDGLPEQEVADQINYYGEMIDDRMEEGLTEEMAVAQIGSAEEIATQILSETPITKLIKARKKRRLTGTEITLLILGFPLWLPLLVAAFAVVFSLWISLWAVVISLWCVPVSLAACGIGGIIGGIILAVTSKALNGIALIGTALVCIGLSVFAFYGCKAATKASAVLTKRLWLWIKKCIMHKEKGK